MFSGGGVAAALVLPVLLFLFGVALPLGWISAPPHAHLLGVLHNPLTRLGLIIVCALALAHFAHRFRYTLADGLKLHRYDVLIATTCYGAALAGWLFAGYVIFVVL
jgi:fumarate reductase subunit D